MSPYDNAMLRIYALMKSSDNFSRRVWYAYSDETLAEAERVAKKYYAEKKKQEN